MYGGSIMESGPVKPIYGDPRHPYTIGLLASVPGTSFSRMDELHFIPGTPPDMIALPKGCPFAQRCAYVSDQCMVEKPGFTQVGPGHQAACWNLENVRASSLVK